ncbi:MAG: CRISPR-associated endoribonuclease Cas6 [Bacillota bacterium]
MRLNLCITPNNETVPFNYQQFLIGAFHKWMGRNSIHDKISLYSFSWLQKAEMTKKGLEFPRGSSWFISFWKPDFGKRLIESIMEDPEICYGMRVTEIQMQDDPEFGNKEKFKLASPVLIRKYDQYKRAVHLTYECEEADHYMKETLLKKMKIANLNYEVNLHFDKEFQGSRTKLIEIKGINNRVSFCPVIIEGDPEAIKFAWNVGLGHSTGCGFGAIF